MRCESIFSIENSCRFLAFNSNGKGTMPNTTVINDVDADIVPKYSE